MDSKNIRVIKSKTNDPIFNLAYEAYLTETAVKDIIVLFLWKNNHTIVIGRNQNPWKECQVNKFRDNSGTIIRRLSGGGAVYHDMGNLNFSIISHKDHYDVTENIEKLKDAMKNLGFDIEFSGKNDLTIQGRKFSGHAFFEIGDNRCHHGAILVNTNLSVLSQYLTPSKLKIMTKSIDSVRARVINLADINPEINITKVSDSIINSLTSNHKFIVETVEETDVVKYAPKWFKSFSSWSWTYGESPDFNVSIDYRYNWGTLDLNMKIVNNKIADIKIYTDSNETRFFQSMMEKLKNQKFDKKLILENINNINSINADIKSDMKNLISKII